MKELIPMNDYGIFADGKDTARANSLIVAKMFGKDHKNVLANIKKTWLLWWISSAQFSADLLHRPVEQKTALCNDDTWRIHFFSNGIHRKESSTIQRSIYQTIQRNGKTDIQCRYRQKRLSNAYRSGKNGTWWTETVSFQQWSRLD